MNETMDLKTDNGTYKADVFHKAFNAFFNIVASDKQHINAHPYTISPQHFLTCFQKAVNAVKILDCCYKKDIDNEEAKICFLLLSSYSYHQLCLSHQS